MTHGNVLNSLNERNLSNHYITVTACCNLGLQKLKEHTETVSLLQLTAWMQIENLPPLQVVTCLYKLWLL